MPTGQIAEMNGIKMNNVLTYGDDTHCKLVKANKNNSSI